MPAVVPGRETVARERHIEPERRNWTWAWVLALIALVLLGGLLAYASGIFGPKPVPVPDVANLPVAEATSTIEGAGLKVGAITPQFSNTVKKGYVISTSPPAKTPIAAGTTVDITVSSGLQEFEVPDVSGKSQQDAITALQPNFQIGTIAQQYSGTVKAGNVISQDPEAGSKQPAGTKVNIVVSLGVKQASVPDVRGKSESDARSTLRGAGFKVATERQNSSDVPKGQVISQDPSGGTQVTSGSTVTIVISSGPATTQVPDVMGKSEQAARNAIRDAELLASVMTSGTTDPNQDGKVLNQSPAGGATATKGSTVTITVGQLQSTTP
jgi:serine/threonine-protein kinase